MQTGKRPNKTIQRAYANKRIFNSELKKWKQKTKYQTNTFEDIFTWYMGMILFCVQGGIIQEQEGLIYFRSGR